MSEKLKPYLTTDDPKDKKCLICGKTLGFNAQNITERGWTALKSNAKEWSEIKLNPGDEYYKFTQQSCWEGYCFRQKTS